MSRSSLVSTQPPT